LRWSKSSCQVRRFTVASKQAQRQKHSKETAAIKLVPGALMLFTLTFCLITGYPQSLVLVAEAALGSSQALEIK